MPLDHAFTRQTYTWFPRQRRYLSYISEFNCTFKHLQGKKNPVADALSKVEKRAVQLGYCDNLHAKKQRWDPDTTEARTSLTALQRMDISLGDSGTTILCNVSTGRPRPCTAASLPRHVFDLVHGLSHPSRRTLRRQLTQMFVWHEIS